MRLFRVLLALLLAAEPLQAQPAVDIISRYSVPVDEAAASATEDSAPQGSGKRLAALEADLSLVSETLEGFAHPEDADKALLSAKSRLPADIAPYFRDRAAALNALYRTLAVVDYTWALRFPNPSCEPAVNRAVLLRSDDGLFVDPASGVASEWIGALLGTDAKTTSVESALDRASASVPLSQAEYARLRASQNQITQALTSKGAAGAERAALYCKRAEARTRLAAANRVTGTVLAARSSAETISRQGVVIIAGVTAEGLEARGAGVVIDTKFGIRVLSDRRLGTGEVTALFDGNRAPVGLEIEREDENAGLILLRPEGDLGEPLTLAAAAPKKDDLVFALAHSERLGAWTKTQGLVTAADQNQFQTDAVADASMAGGAVLDENGKVAGILVLRPAGDAVGDWPVGVSALALKAWIESGEAPSISPVNLKDEGTTKILTASRPLLESVAVGTGASAAGYGFDTQTQWGTVHARCMANCDDSSPGSSYSDNGSAELGAALGKLAAVGAQALIFQGIPALMRGIGSLFKSKPRPPKVAPPAPEIKIAPKIVEPVKEEPPIECRISKVDEPANIGIETVELKVRFSCSDKSVPVGNRKISFTLGWENEVPAYRVIVATTDADGYASISFHIDNAVANAARSFNDLDRFDPEKNLTREVESVAEDGPPAEAGEAQGGGLINASDSKPVQAENKKRDAGPQARPKSSSVVDYALGGTGARIRSVARVVADREVAGAVAGRAAARTAVGEAVAEGAAGGTLVGGARLPGGKYILGVVAVAFTVNWAVGKIRGRNKPHAALTSNQPGDSSAPKPDPFAALRESAAVGEDEDECAEARRRGDILAQFIDGTRLAPGFLNKHEGGEADGHTLRKHVIDLPGRDKAEFIRWMSSRIDPENENRESSSAFYDQTIAEEAIRLAIEARKAEIAAWRFDEKGRNSTQFSFPGDAVFVGLGIRTGETGTTHWRGLTMRLTRMPVCRIAINSAWPRYP